MTGHRLRVALALALALCVAAAVGLAGSASAHESDCHAQQSCPSDDHSYVWSDGTKLWDCGLADGATAEVTTTVIVYEGISYVCTEVPDNTTTTPEPPAPPPTSTGPPPDDVVTEPPPPPPPPKPEKPEAEEPTAPEPTPFVPRIPNRRPVLPPGRYVFPIDGPASYSDTFGAARADTGWHHGEDIFAPLGTPLVAVADGTLLKVGWNAIGGNRLWLRDRWGNYFYYAHLSGFAPGAVSGAPVIRGEVVGYVGNTGDAVGTPYHLHFEIHPATMLDLGYDGVVNPFQYLQRWQRAGELIRTGRITPSAPTPGAILLTAADISSASGLEPETVVRRASAPVTVEREGHVLLPLPPATREELVGSDDQLTDVLDSAASSFADVRGSTVWDTLATCESSNDWHANTGLYDGGLQFHPGTWRRYGGTAFAPFAYLATREQQITIARRVLAVEGWEAWPACSLKLGLR
jgi:Transglycosylase-like domain/Peptidase family M23